MALSPSPLLLLQLLLQLQPLLLPALQQQMLLLPALLLLLLLVRLQLPQLLQLQLLQPPRRGSSFAENLGKPKKDVSLDPASL